MTQCTTRKDEFEISCRDFVDSGATINAVSPHFILKNCLEDGIVSHQKRLRLTMLRAVNPRINWWQRQIRPPLSQIKSRMRDLLAAFKVSRPQSISPSRESRRCTTEHRAAFYSIDTGTTRCISSKQFRRMLQMSKDVDREVITKATSIDNYKNHPIYPYLRKYNGLFRQKLPEHLPPKEHGEHVMDVHSEDPIFRPQWRQSPAQEAEICRRTREMLAANMVRPTTSPHGAPTFCVKKPDGWRIVHYYRALNLNTVRRTMPMPRKYVILEKMQGSYYFSCLDLLSGYYQFRMREDGIPYTGFQTPDGLFGYLVVPVGLSNAPATFNTGKLRPQHQDHLDALDRVFSRLHEHRVYVKLSKCVLCAPVIPCLGDIVGVRISPTNWPPPKTQNQLQSFLGTATYVRRFCKNFAIDAGPMFNLLKRLDKEVPWTDELHQHFESLKKTISQTPALGIADFSKKFYLRMNASDFIMGGVLFQKQFRDGKEIERPIAFAGRKYKATEVNYSVRGKNSWLYYLVYLLDRPFCVVTDHKSLETVFKQKSISRRIARWYDELADYSFDIKYVWGADDGVADGVSRRPDFEDTTEVITLATIIDEAVARYEEAPVTSVLLKFFETSSKTMSTSPLIKHLDRYSWSDNNGFYQAHHDPTPRLVIPRLREISEALIAEFHDRPVYGHPGIDRTSRHIEASYFWPHLTRDLAKYVKGCEICVRMKPRNSKAPGFLHSHANLS
ncbi:hypothetical protein PHMEG_0007611 [Phytophthora megakarya]|uniref:Reverse transcriptase n=1 Tax=Phytophthora megakarya TaxID=4795 RepID=A0A225WMT3_9STRA|nr:hypothetical protein PHMEG_0007611 [Phytophthora megakarya]